MDKRGGRSRHRIPHDPSDRPEESRRALVESIRGLSPSQLAERASRLFDAYRRERRPR